MIQILLVTALCLDTFAAGFSYTVNNTRIPLKSITIISFICTAVLTCSLSISSAVKQIIPVNITGIVCFTLLFTIGLMKCFESFIKSWISAGQYSKHFKLKLFDINFVLMVYTDNIKADIDNSKLLSPKEAVYLAIALSLDGFAAGFGYGLTDINYLEIIVLSFVSNILAVMLGSVSGKFLRNYTDFDFSWLGGVILILLAFSKLN
ncbi:MAG: manganese efflux pump [Eubacteriales bacterium]